MNNSQIPGEWLSRVKKMYTSIADSIVDLLHFSFLLDFNNVSWTGFYYSFVHFWQHFIWQLWSFHLRACFGGIHLRDIDVGLTIISKVLTINEGQKCPHYFLQMFKFNSDWSLFAKIRDQLVYRMSVLYWDIQALKIKI